MRQPTACSSSAALRIASTLLSNASAHFGPVSAKFSFPCRVRHRFQRRSAYPQVRPVGQRHPRTCNQSTILQQSLIHILNQLPQAKQRPELFWIVFCRAAVSAMCWNTRSINRASFLSGCPRGTYAGPPHIATSHCSGLDGDAENFLVPQ